MSKIRCESVDRLFKTILSLETVEECYAYFEDICTIKEIQDMSQRLDTAILLSKGMSYQRIAEAVDVSSATIGRVSKCLNYGTGGYRKAIELLRKRPEIAGNQRAQEMLKIVQDGDDAKGEELANNLLRNYGMTKQQGIEAAQRFFQGRR